MFNRLKLAFGAAFLAVVVSVVLVLAQTSNFTNLAASGTVTSGTTMTVGTTLTVGSAPITIGSYSALKTMTFLIDSIGYDANIAIFTLERGITCMRGDLLCKSATGTDTCWAKLQCGAVSFAVKCTTDGTKGIATTTDVSFAAGSVCTLMTVDESSGTGGTGAQFVIQYTDY